MRESFGQIAAHNEGLARDIVERASAHGVTVSTAESLTAGMIASTIADIPGASAVLRGGAVTYCDEIKHRVLGVEQATAIPRCRIRRRARWLPVRWSCTRAILP